MKGLTTETLRVLYVIGMQNRSVLRRGNMAVIKIWTDTVVTVEIYMLLFQRKLSSNHKTDFFKTLVIYASPKWSLVCYFENIYTHTHAMYMCVYGKKWTYMSVYTSWHWGSWNIIPTGERKCFYKPKQMLDINIIYTCTNSLWFYYQNS